MFNSRKIIPLILLLTLLLISAYGGQAKTPNAQTHPVITPASGQEVFNVYGVAIPFPAGLNEDKNKEMPGAGTTAFYFAPDLSQKDFESHFEEIMPALGFESQGRVGPSLIYHKDPLMLITQLPEDGCLIITMMNSADR